MTLIKSISGIRGTIGGEAGNALTPLDIVRFTAAYALRLQQRLHKNTYKVVVGRDARISGQMVDSLVCGTLMACGVNVVNAGLASTPTVEMAVIFEHADGGIILTASHNPKQWNALKLLNEKGEFLDAAEGNALLKAAANDEFHFCDVDNLGKMEYKDFTDAHIEAVVNYPLVDRAAISQANFTVVLDAVNSVGGIIMPKLFDALGVKYYTVNCEPTGHFAHNPEPLPAHLTDLSAMVVAKKADLGVSVDPDVDRLALMCENGEPFGEEYTLVSVADYVLSQKPGPTVSNLSSSRALKDLTESYGCTYSASAVGEVNVSTMMKSTGAVIGGEGNGGVIVPDLHYGRDALIGVALFLSNLARKKMPVSALKETYPQYIISKNRIDLSNPILIDRILEAVKAEYAGERISTVDGVKIDFDKERMWVHLRKSNTEPIIRIYSEAATLEQADELAGRIMAIANRIKG